MDVCSGAGWETGAGYCVATGIHRQYCQTSRGRDDVSDLLVLIKKSHKAPPGRDIAAGARYIITMIHRVPVAADPCGDCQERD